MQVDLQMYYAPTDKAMECRTSNLNEELGMIDFIFSDTAEEIRGIMKFGMLYKYFFQI